jgi:hypothetical protein
VGKGVFEGKAAYRITFKGQFAPGATRSMPSAILGFSETTVDIMGEAILDKTDSSIPSVTKSTTYSKTGPDAGKEPISYQKIQKSQKRVG